MLSTKNKAPKVKLDSSKLLGIDQLPKKSKATRNLKQQVSLLTKVGTKGRPLE
ncbi:MAG TPA: hypothetical protein VFS47_03610 [Steroidobacteraceae bacterium]|nr:hypothetical protein [Steroidobacteraceae bacterium]